MISPNKERCTKSNYLDLTLMELLDTEVNINLCSPIIKNMQRVFLKDNKKAHALPYDFWLASDFEDYSVLMQICTLQMTKDSFRCLNHVALPVLVKQKNIPMQRLRK